MTKIGYAQVSTLDVNLDLQPNASKSESRKQIFFRLKNGQIYCGLFSFSYTTRPFPPGLDQENRAADKLFLV